MTYESLVCEKLLIYFADIIQNIKIISGKWTLVAELVVTVLAFKQTVSESSVSSQSEMVTISPLFDFSDLYVGLEKTLTEKHSFDLTY